MAETSEPSSSRTVYVAWAQYDEEIIGVYSTRALAVQAMERGCDLTHGINSSHPKHGDMWKCGIRPYLLDQQPE